MAKTKLTTKGTTMPILNLKGKDYLEVKWRLVWFRENHPNGTIKTEIVSHDDNYSVVRADIYADGSLLSSGSKREDKKHFADHLEKAETGAIGRALAVCGYGTQFDGGDMAEGDRLADAPVAMPKPKDYFPHVKDKRSLGKATVKAPIGDDLYKKIVAKVNLITKGGEDKAKIKEIKGKLGIKTMADLKAWDDDKLAVAIKVL